MKMSHPFSPTTFLETFSESDHIPTPTNKKTFLACIQEAFDLPQNDTYTYRAAGETTLAITQKAINGHRAHGLHNWYHDPSGAPTTSPPDPYPTQEEIAAYIFLFDPKASLPKALNAFRASSKSKTLRGEISQHLSERYYNTSTGLVPSSKPSRTHTNPYHSYLSYTLHTLEYAGPWPNTVYTKHSHHMLPILYHHFGCVCPSYAALHAIAKLSQPSKPSKEPVRPILDVGSGNGYWTFMLRQLTLPDGWKDLDVRAVDNGTSEYRIKWIEDTVQKDGLDYLSSLPAEHKNGKGSVLLLVYPQTTGNFTAPILCAFDGDAIVVAGTQNKNGFTAFSHFVVDEWVEKNLGDKWELTLRMPLMSFPAKDEALFVFQRRKKNA